MRSKDIIDDGPLKVSSIEVDNLDEKTAEHGIVTAAPITGEASTLTVDSVYVDDVYEKTANHNTIIHDAVAQPSQFVLASVSGTPTLRTYNDAVASASATTETLLLALPTPIPVNHLANGTYRFTFELKKTGSPTNRTCAIKDQFGNFIWGAQIGPSDDYYLYTYDLLIINPGGLKMSFYATAGTGGTIDVRNFHLLTTETVTAPGWS